MAYTADLITVLKSLFGQVIQPSSSEAPKVTKQALTKVYQTHRTSDTRREIYRRISEEFLIMARDLSFLLEVSRRLLFQSLGFDPVSPLDSRGGASSSAPLPSTSTEVAGIPLLSPQSVGVFTFTLKPQRAGRTASSQSTSPPFWRYHRP